MTTKSHTARQRRRAPWATKAGPTLQTLRKLRARGWGTRKTNCISLRSAFLQNIGGIPRLPRKRTRAQRLRPRQVRNDDEKPQGPATSFVLACAFAPVAGALGYKIGRAEARRYRKTNGGAARTRKRNRTLENEGCGTRAARTHPSDPSQAPFGTQGKQGKRAGHPKKRCSVRHVSGRWCW